MTLDEFKKYIENDMPHVSDEELFEIKTMMEDFADMYFTSWLADIDK